MRGRSNHHLVITDRGENYEATGHRWRYVAVCGEEFNWGTFAAKPEDRQCCRKCHAKFYADKLKAQPSGLKLGKTLTDPEKEALGKRWGFRVIYPITDDAGTEWGFVALPGGWGEAWRLISWHVKFDGADDDDTPTFQIGHQLCTGSGGELSFASKEYALWRLPELFAERSILPKADRLAQRLAAREKHRQDQAQWAIDSAERDAARERQRAIDAARARDTLAALIEIHDTFGAALTNFQADGLADAIKRLGNPS